MKHKSTLIWFAKSCHLCLPLSVQENCANVAAARLMSKQLQWIQDIEVGTGQILLPYGMPDKQYQKEAVYNTSKVQYMHDIKGEGHIPPRPVLI